MSAFLAYGGAYEFAGRHYRWRCYATARVHEIRKREHGPDPQPPHGKQWVAAAMRHGDPEVICLMDEGIGEFSQMLVQVEPQGMAAARRPAQAALSAH